MDWIMILKDLGLLGLVGLILNWVFTEQARLNTQIDTERKKWMEQSDLQSKRWQEIINNFSNCQAQFMQEHRDFKEQQAEANKYVREEHKTMINQLQEITVTLGRINGYKHE